MSYWWNEPITTLIPGDLGSVDGLSSNLRATGESIATQAARLRGVNTDIWVGEAASEFAEHIEDTPRDLDLLAERYTGVAAALDGYSDGLRDAQAKVATAKQKASEAHAAQLSAASALRDAEASNLWAQRSAEDQSSAYPDAPPVTPSLTDLGPLQRRASDTDAAMREAEELRLEAERDRDEAAGGCKRTIEGCVDDDLKDQGGFWGWVKHTFEKIAPILAVVAAVVGIVALFIPGLNLIALGLAVACLVVDSANYFVFHQGDLLTVALDLVGVAAFASALKAAKAAHAADAASGASAGSGTARASTTTASLEQQAASRARTLQGLLPDGSKGRVTMGVGIGQDAAGALRTVVGTSERGGYLRPAVRAAIRDGEEVASGASHAERNILAHMAWNGIRPITIGAGRPVCPPCAGAITEASATAATPLKVPPLKMVQGP